MGVSLFKKDTGYYYISVYSPNRRPKRKQVALKTKSKREALQLFQQWEEDWESGAADPWNDAAATERDDLTTLDGAVRGFIKSRLNLSPFTVTKYRSVLGLFSAHLGPDFPIKSVQPEHVQSFLNNPTTVKTKAGKERRLIKKPITKKTYTTTLSPFFNWLIDRGAIRRNPVERVRLEKVPQKFPRFLSPADVDAICKAIKQRQVEKHVGKDTGEWLIPIVRTNVFLGLRAGELVNLRWDAVDLERRTVTIANTETFKTKSGKGRVLPLPEPAYEILRDLKATCEYVFTNYGGTKLHRQYLSRAFKHYAGDAGLHHVNFHTTRHTCASWLAQAGCSIEAIRLYMGHSSVTVTQKYMHLSPNAVADQVNRAFARAA